ncbi:MAG: hypothetical protein K2R98_15045 [Gemmataceae bacterium]|nr:hypothetical protein [Gemmataceae bacterium]
MKERERGVVSGMVVLMLLFWLGFLFHRSPRFAGSFWGGMLAVAGTLLMLVPLAYLIVKRIPPLKKAATRRVSMQTLLVLHIYAGVLGPILVILHTGHKFESPLGVALTAMTLVVVLSGFAGRYLMNQFRQTIGEKKEILTRLEAAYRQTAGELADHPEQMAALRPLAGFSGRLAAGLLVATPGFGPGAVSVSVRALQLAESMADLEYAIKTHENFKRWFGQWLKWHIVISFILYALLALHIWAGIHFGLRWFS